MKKIIILFFGLSIFLFAECESSLVSGSNYVNYFNNNSDCVCPPYNSENQPQYLVQVSDTVTSPTLYYAPGITVNVGSYWTGTTSLVTNTISSLYPPITNPDTGALQYNVAVQSYTNYECVSCDEPDVNYPMPADINYTTLPGINSCATAQQNQPYQDACDAVSGYMHIVQKENCCEIALCIVPIDDNITSPDDNITCPPPLIQDTFSSTCSCPADTYLVTVDSEPRCLPNSDCTTNMHTSDINNQCICNDGFVPGINLDCIPYVPDNNDTDDNTSANCAPGTYDCNGQCVLNGVTCYDSDYDENDGNSDNDPCSYPGTSSNDYSYQGNAANAEECQSYSLALGDGNSQYLKNEDCWFGVCYYNNSTNDNNSTPPPPIPPVPGDVNGTVGDGNLTQNIDLNMSNIAIPLDGINAKLEDIKEVITNQSNRQHNDLINNGLAINKASSDIVGAIGQQTTSLSAVLNSLNESQNNSRSQSANGISGAISSQTNTLGTKLDDILNELRESNDANSSNDINISLDLNETNNLLRDINSTLSHALYPDSDSVNDAMNPFNNAFDGAKQAFSDSLTTFGNSKDSLIALASGATPPTITTGGSCGISFDWHGRTVNIDLSSVAPLAPYVQFVLNLYLLIITLRYYTIIARDIASYFFSGN